MASIEHGTIRQTLGTLSTAHLADACIRVGTQVRCAPAGLTALAGGMRCAGRVLPTRHAGSVDIFLEALERASPGDVLVADNGGRLDEACIGDLVTLEVQKAELAGIVIWGLHRDTDELLEIGLPLFSLGAIATGPLRLDPRAPDCLERAYVGSWMLTVDDFAVCDSDGVIFLPEAQLQQIVAAAASIRETERKQAEKMRSGVSLRDQTRFGEYAAARASNPTLGFREYLRGLGAAVEE